MRFNMQSSCGAVSHKPSLTKRKSGVNISMMRRLLQVFAVRQFPQEKTDTLPLVPFGSVSFAIKPIKPIIVTS
jgi:hypothetical protein